MTGRLFDFCLFQANDMNAGKPARPAIGYEVIGFFFADF
jgi:hypothetical protein